MVPRSKISKTLVCIACGVFVAGCGPIFSSSNKSKVSIQFPNAGQLVSGKVGASATAFDWARVCFMVNVTASDLSKQAQSGCDIPVGIFRGAVAPGGEVSLEVPRGFARKLEIFTYLRESASSPCPGLEGGFGTLDRSKVARVAEVPSFDTQAPEITLDVTLSEPAAGASLLSQYGLPASCGNQTTTVAGGARVTSGHARQQGGVFLIDGSVSAQSNETVLNGGSFKMRLSRKSR